MKTTQISEQVREVLGKMGRSADDVLRDALGIKPEGLDVGGAVLPEGTFLRTWYKDRPYWGQVVGGMIEIAGTQYKSVSGAARHVTHRPTNGFDFWEAKLPGRAEWVPLSKLRADTGNAH